MSDRHGPSLPPRRGPNLPPRPSKGIKKPSPSSTETASSASAASQGGSSGLIDHGARPLPETLRSAASSLPLDMRPPVTTEQVTHASADTLPRILAPRARRTEVPAATQSVLMARKPSDSIPLSFSSFSGRGPSVPAQGRPPGTTTGRDPLSAATQSILMPRPSARPSRRAHPSSPTQDGPSTTLSFTPQQQRGMMNIPLDNARFSDLNLMRRPGSSRDFPRNSAPGPVEGIPRLRADYGVQPARQREAVPYGGPAPYIANPRSVVPPRLAVEGAARPTIPERSIEETLRDGVSAPPAGIPRHGVDYGRRREPRRQGPIPNSGIPNVTAPAPLRGSLPSVETHRPSNRPSSTSARGSNPNQQIRQAAQPSRRARTATRQYQTKTVLTRDLIEAKRNIQQLQQNLVLLGAEIYVSEDVKCESECDDFRQIRTEIMNEEDRIRALEQEIAESDHVAPQRSRSRSRDGRGTAGPSIGGNVSDPSRTFTDPSRTITDPSRTITDPLVRARIITAGGSSADSDAAGPSSTRTAGAGGSGTRGKADGTSGRRGTRG